MKWNGLYTAIGVIEIAISVRHVVSAHLKSIIS